MRERKWLLIGLLSPAAIYLALSYRVHPMPDHPFFRSPVMVVAHRGGRGLAPENSFEAFRRSVDLGVDVLEMDLRQSADGALVVFHDARVDRTTDGTGRVDELTVSELKRLDAGYSWSADGGTTHPFRGRGIGIPLLEEVFAAFPGVRLNLEMKVSHPSVAHALCALVRAHSREESVLVAARDHAVLQLFRAECPQVATAASAREVQVFYWLHRLWLDGIYQPRAEAFQVPERLGSLEVATPRFVRRARSKGARVQIWTANRAEDMERLLAMEVDGIMTDFPDVLLALLGR